MREWSKAAFDKALATAERMEGRPLDAHTVHWMRWAYLQAWLSPLGYAYEVRHDDATIGPVSFDQLVRARTEGKIPDGSEARITGEWTSVGDLLAGRSLDLGSYEASRSFFEDAEGTPQLVQRLVSALHGLPRVDDAMRGKIENDVYQRGWRRQDIPIDALTAALGDLLGGAIEGATLTGCSFGEHQFHCIRRGALALGLHFLMQATGASTRVMLYGFRKGDNYVVVTSRPG